jgi:branched-chain amino acid transport system substrate-binding protein
MDTKLSISRNFKRRFLFILSIFVITAMAFPFSMNANALEPCSDPLGCVEIAANDPVHIAYLLAVSGPVSSLGIDSLHGIELAVDDSGGTILGHEIRIDGQDDGCSEAGGAAAGAILSDDPSVVAVIGTSCSAAARAAMPVLSEAGFAVVSPSNTAPDLTEPGSPTQYSGYLRVSWSDKFQGTAAARFAREVLGVSTAATLQDGSLYGTHLQQAFTEEFTNLGGTITEQMVVNPDQEDMTAELSAIAEGTPSMLYSPVYSGQGINLINQARTIPGLENTYLMGSDAFWTEEIVNATGENIEGLFLTSADFTKNSPAYTESFLPAYEAKFGTQPISSFHAHAYDAFMLVRAAIESVARVDPDGTIQIGRQALRDALYGTTNLTGLTGNLTCSATGDCADPHFAVYRYRSGQFPPEYFWPQEQKIPWRDEFDGALGDGWTWRNENQDKWGFNNGFLRINTSSGGTGAENLLLRPVAEGDFSIETRLLFAPDTNYQIAGLVIWQDAENFLQFGRAFCGNEEACVGNGIYFDKLLGGGFSDGNFATQFDNPFNPSEAYLRLERRGGMVRAFYSHEGITWNEIGTHWIPEDFRVTAVGLTSAQDFSNAAIPADFDYFELTEGWGFLPEGYHDYESGDVPDTACRAGGWAVDPDDRGENIPVEIDVDGVALPDWVLAGEYRPDLEEAGLCVGGNCGFSTSLWDKMSSYEPHSIVTYAQDIQSGEWVTLSNSPKELTCRSYDIYAYDPLTGAARLITKHQPGTGEYDPTWSPNGKMIAHDVVSADSHGIYVTDVKTGVSTKLIGADGGNDASWSPNGKWIAFDRRWYADPNIYAVQAAGGRRSLLRADAVSVNWAPNGKRIVFQDNTDGSIRTAPVDGGPGAETLIADYGGTPSWSPDGNWIAYSRDGDIWKVKVNVQGIVLGEPVQLTSNPFYDGKPTWSSDSRTIIYDTNFGQDSDLWSIPAAGGTTTWLSGAPVFGEYGPANARNSSTIAFAGFSPQVQAPRTWVAAFTYGLPGTLKEGTHTYHFEAAGLDNTPEISLEVESDRGLYDGTVLLRPWSVLARSGEGCSEIDALINPNQRTKFYVGWTAEGTYPDALAYYQNLDAQVIWDSGAPVDLAQHEIFPITSSVDWFGYTCNYTSGPPPARVTVQITDDWFRVENFTPITSIGFKIYDGETLLLQGTTSQTDWNGTVTHWVGDQVDLVPGNRVIVTDGVTTREIVLEDLKFEVFNLANGQLSGTAPAPIGRDVWVGIGWDNDFSWTMNVSTDGTGAWLADFEQPVPSDYLWVAAQIFDEDGDASELRPSQIYPTLFAWLEWDQVDGHGWREGETVTLTINGGEHVLSQTTGNTKLVFDLRAAGHDLTVGDRITLSDGLITKELLVPEITVTDYDLGANTVSGTYDPNLGFRTYLEGKPPLNVTFDGNLWTAYYDDIGPMMWGDAVQRDADSDEVAATLRTPNPVFYAVPDEERIYASEWSPGKNLIVSVDGVEVASQVVPESGSPYGPEVMFDLNDSNFDLQGDQVVSLTDGRSTKELVVDSLHVTDFDLGTHTIFGIADPGPLLIGVAGEEMSITVPENGIWQASSPGFEPLEWGAAIKTDEDGDQTRDIFMIPRPMMYAYVDENVVAGVVWKEGEDLTLKIYDAMTGGLVYVKTEVVPPPSVVPWTAVHFYPGDEDYTMKPGDRLVMSQNGYERELILSPLVITGFDLSTRTLMGTGHPGAEFLINIYDLDIEIDATVNQNGTWSVFLDVPAEGLWVAVTEIDSDGDETRDRFQLPTMAALE